MTCCRDEAPWTPAMSMTTDVSHSREQWYRKPMRASMKFWKGLHFLPKHLDPIAEQKFHRIDMVARRVFPLTFSTIVFTYSMLYTYYIPDRIEDPDSTELKF